MSSIKKKWKQKAAMLLAFLMVISLAGCGAEEESAPREESQKTTGTAEVADTESDSSKQSAEETENTEKESDSNETQDTEEETTLAEIQDIEEETASAEIQDTEEETTPAEVQDTEEETTPAEIQDTEEEAASEETRDTEEETTLAEIQDIEEETASEETQDTEEETSDDGLDPTMRNSINMLNYMTSLTQQVNEQKNNQLFLESAYDSFDNLFPNSVDMKTQAQITSLMDTIQAYCMISVKRDRIEYIYEQSRAQALRQALPNPIGFLSAVVSAADRPAITGINMKAVVSVIYMAIDSIASYKSAVSQADLEFIKDGWELDDEESEELHNSTKNALTYMLNMVRDYDIPGDYALNKAAVEDFVSWSSKPDSELERKISWFETNQDTYSEFGPYWLELTKDYYNYENYEKCLEAIKRYESITTRIFRKDQDYANALPMAIISAQETLSESEYVDLAAKYCQIIHDNTDDEDWTLRYFAAQIYMDLFAITKDDAYLDEAYKIARENVVVLVDEQKKLNTAYVEEIQEIKADKDATKRQKNEIKKYNKTIKDERKVELPPVSEALYLNSDLLFGLAKERNVGAEEQEKIEAILHENGENIFLTQALDDHFWFNKTSDSMEPDEIEVSFEGGKFTIPASCVMDRSAIKVDVSGKNVEANFDEWTVDEVKRPKDSTDCTEFKVTYVNEDAGKYKFQEGDTVTIRVTPVAEFPEEYMEFRFNAVAAKKAFVFDSVEFERVTK